MTGTGLQEDMLDLLCPMHLVLDAGGHLVSAGPTLRKVLDLKSSSAVSFFDLFDVRRPQNLVSADGLRAAAGEKLRLRFRGPPHLEVKAILYAGLPDGKMVMNLSFGINVISAVQEFDLTAADFAVTDLAVEMLYLVEAKSAAMEASKQLNRRLVSARETAELQALTDALTGLSNRRGMDPFMEKLMSANEPFALMQLDLDYFKQINDTLGHAAGDFVLIEVAKILRGATRADDLVARLGGDEFVLVLRGIVDRDTVSQIAGRVIDDLSRPMRFAGHDCSVSASAGTALSVDYETPGAETMLRDADLALYFAKDEGRGCHRFFSSDLRRQQVRDVPQNEGKQSA